MTTVFGVSGCVLDLNANDSESIEIVEGKVASWTDSAGSRVFSQADAGKRPVMGTLNGEPAVQFDRSNLEKLISTTSVVVPQPATIVAVAQFTVGGVNSIALSTSAVVPLQHHPTAAPGKLTVYTTGSGNVVSGAGDYTSDPVLASMILDGGNSKSIINGVMMSFSSSSSLNSAMHLGGWYSTELWPFSGSLARILIFDHVVTDQEILAIRYGTITEHGFDQPADQQIVKLRRGVAGTTPAAHADDAPLRLPTR